MKKGTKSTMRSMLYLFSTPHDKRNVNHIRLVIHAKSVHSDVDAEPEGVLTL